MNLRDSGQAAVSARLGREGSAAVAGALTQQLAGRWLALSLPAQALPVDKNRFYAAGLADQTVLPGG